MEQIWQLFLANRKLIGTILGYVGVAAATLIYLQKANFGLCFSWCWVFVQPHILG